MIPIVIKEVNGIKIRLAESRVDGGALGVVALVCFVFGSLIFVGSILQYNILGLIIGGCALIYDLCFFIFLYGKKMWVVFTNVEYSKYSKSFLKTSSLETDRSRICNAVKEIEGEILEGADRQKQMAKLAENCK
jgi:membrane-bound ClpP family serine protease